MADLRDECKCCGGVFVGPQAPGAGIRPLGFPRISSGAQSRLPRSARTMLSSLAPNRRTAAARPTGRRALWRDSQGDGRRRPALEV